MPTTRLILIRHGHTASNGTDGARMSGRTDVPLSARGRAEIARLCDRLRGTAPFAAIYTSPLQRAHRTALALAGAGLGRVRICAALQEIDCGVLDGVPLSDVQQRFPALWAANCRQDDERFRWPGGESYRELRCRSLQAVRAVARAHPGARVALVTHAGVISQIVGAIEGVSPARWECHRPANTALTEIDWGRGEGVVVRFDDRGHLGGGRLR
ncbi:MAG TPA: histidine phosphatase family protein [Gemmatimonadaceae bacterium]|nr:histidine phosphatase family protein [Gemmatimonadaceae bacterium]